MLIRPRYGCRWLHAFDENHTKYYRTDHTRSDRQKTRFERLLCSSLIFGSKNDRLIDSTTEWKQWNVGRGWSNGPALLYATGSSPLQRGFRRSSLKSLMIYNFNNDIMLSICQWLSYWLLFWIVQRHVCNQAYYGGMTGRSIPQRQLLVDQNWN